MRYGAIKDSLYLRFTWYV